MKQLPQPAKNTVPTIKIAMGLFSDLTFTSSFLTEIVSAKIEARIEKSRDILIGRVEELGLTALDDPQVEFFIPATYQFIERVRAAEYEYNLRLLADIIANTLASDAPPLDCGKVGRAARALEFLSEPELMAAAYTHIALSAKAPVDFEETKQAIALHRDILDVYHQFERQISESELGNLLKELSIRGLVFDLAGRNQFGGYTSSKVLDEIMQAAGDRLKRENGG